MPHRVEDVIKYEGWHINYICIGIDVEEFYWQKNSGSLGLPSTTVQVLRTYEMSRTAPHNLVPS